MSVIAAGLLAAQAGVAMAGDVDFVRDVQPILSSHCYQCHGPDESSRQAGLRLDSGPAAYEGVDGRPAVAPHHPEESELIRRVFADDPAAIMPPPDAKHPLTPRQKQTLRDWVAAGGAYAPHWSFAAPVRHEPPQVRNAQWVRDDLDRFILHELEAQNLTPSPEADLHTLIRRVSFDLVGLAPTPDEVRAFIDDAQATSRDQAYARLVDRLLASPHFGERWGRHWLDVARYADSDGYERDYQRPGAWHWRAWVIDSFNRDQPYDEFVLEQIAGDMLPDATADQRLASAFHRNELHNTEGGIDVGESNWRKAVGQVNAVGAAFMGLTVACAECHSHKHDPLTQREYYEMLAFFYGQMEERDIPAADFADASKRGVAVKPGTREGDSLQKYLDGDWYHVVVERERPRATHVRVRGVYTDKGDRVEAGTPAFLPPLAARDDAPDRLDLARWLASREHPLTARVAVNRIWARLMGVGIVATVDDRRRMLALLLVPLRGLHERRRVATRLRAAGCKRQQQGAAQDQRAGHRFEGG